MAASIVRKLGAGSVSLGVHSESGTGHDAVAGLVAQAVSAEGAGFDGLTVSEHHGDFPGYIGQPLLAATWMLARTQSVWSGPCPTLLTIRNPVEVAEAAAWTAAAFPGRFVLGVAPGYHAPDFVRWGDRFAAVAARYDAGLDALSAALQSDGPLAGDAAIIEWAAAPSPVLSAAGSATGARRAARYDLGVVVSGHMPRAQVASIIDAYRDGGGHGPVVVIKRVWLGEPPVDALNEMASTYRAVGAPSTGHSWEPGTHVGSQDQILEELLGSLDGVGVTDLNVRVHLPSVERGAIIDQIERVGAGLVDELREFLGQRVVAR